MKIKTIMTKNVSFLGSAQALNEDVILKPINSGSVRVNRFPAYKNQRQGEIQFDPLSAGKLLETYGSKPDISNTGAIQKPFMSRSKSAQEKPADLFEQDPEKNSLEQVPIVVVCAETAVSTSKIMPNAKAIASALGAKLMLAHVLENHNTNYFPADPVEWELCRREAEAFVSALSEEHASIELSISSKVMQGRISEQIGTCVTNDLIDTVALCRSDIDSPGKIGQTARRIVEGIGSSVLMIPANSMGTSEPLYRRILVPLDGSSRAETAIQVAQKIARIQGAEIILAHAVPEPFLIEVGPLETEDFELKNRLQRRNLLVAQDYLARQCEQIRSNGVAARPVVLIDGDARRQLNRAIITESADLVIISSHGDSGHTDTSTGDTAVFLLAHSTVPVLMMRQAQNNRHPHVHDTAQSNGVRPPTGVS